MESPDGRTERREGESPSDLPPERNTALGPVPGLGRREVTDGTSLFGSAALAAVRAEADRISRLIAHSMIIPGDWTDALQQTVQAPLAVLQGTIQSIMSTALVPAVPTGALEAGLVRFANDAARQSALASTLASTMDHRVVNAVVAMAEANSATALAAARMGQRMAGLVEGLPVDWGRIDADRLSEHMRYLSADETVTERADDDRTDGAFLLALGILLYVLANTPGWVAQMALGRPLTSDEQFVLVRAVLEGWGAWAASNGGYRWLSSVWTRRVHGRPSAPHDAS